MHKSESCKLCVSMQVYNIVSLFFVLLKIFKAAKDSTNLFSTTDKSPVAHRVRLESEVKSIKMANQPEAYVAG